MKVADGRRLRFGRLPRDETISSKQLQIENRILEERLAAVKKYCEDERKKTEAKQSSTSSSKGFAIRDLRRINMRPSEREQAQQAKELQNQKPVFAKKGIRAFEEVVKNRKNKPQQTKEDMEDGLVALLESLNMSKFIQDFKKAGIYTMEALKEFDLAKLGLLPGFEIKLNKKISEMKSKQAEPKRSSQMASRQAMIKDCSDDDSDFLTKKSVPTEKPRRYRQLLGKQKSHHEDSTMSDLKHRQNDSSIGRPVHDDFSCGPSDSNSKLPQGSCWNCLTLISSSMVGHSHPILEGKTYCSVECLRSDFKSVASECPTCKKIIVKPNGIVRGGLWYCQQACMADMEEFEGDPDDCFEEGGEADHKSSQSLCDPEDGEDHDTDLNFDELIN